MRSRAISSTVTPRRAPVYGIRRGGVTRPHGSHEPLHARARHKGVNPIVYWLMRAWLQPFAHLYWRLSRIGREHVPQTGPVIFVSNHRSFIDPFIVGLCNRRPVYYVAKEELFKQPAARLVPQLARRLPGPPRRRRRGLHRDREGDPQARRPGADLPRGHAHAPRRARQAQARRRPARAGDRSDRRPGRDHRHRGDPQGLPDPPAQDPRPDRRAAATSRRSRPPPRSSPPRSPTASGPT